MDERFMKESLRQARKGLGRTSPNPAVGSVIVRESRIIARGYHHKAGAPHAEVEALKKLGGQAEGATLYVTLEPCNHHGKTPPCAEAILNSGIVKVVVGMLDPNPRVSGGGCEFLKQNGVQVSTGVLESECRKLNEDYIKFVTSNHPFIIVKSALTLDGWTATVTGHSKWITNNQSREYVHRLRNRVDAVMVGVGTVIADNPMLTTRLKRGHGKDPLRIIVDTHLRTPFSAGIVNHNSSAKTLIAVGATEVSEEKKTQFKKKRNVSILACPVEGGKISLPGLMTLLADKNITSILVEGGASIIGSILREHLADKFYIFKAPMILGGDDGIPMATGSGPKTMDGCLTLRNIKRRRFGDDLLIEGYPDYNG
jgi:diaminohydroxyphosphoribosylaminopyrimidine deaminase/5-amino-6-(5-phosphoribosylamino)uracil reductase